jgi:hypothetical protein
VRRSARVARLSATLGFEVEPLPGFGPGVAQQVILYGRLAPVPLREFFSAETNGADDLFFVAQRGVLWAAERGFVLQVG